MASNYPGAIDNFAESSPTYMSDQDTTGRTHEARHNDVESAVEAIETALGANPPRLRFDESVGRRLFATDKNNGGREQMVYGDTGWRQIPAGDLINGWTSGDTGLIIRRLDNVVYLTTYYLIGNGATADPFYLLPDGFRASTYTTLAAAIDGAWTGSMADHAYASCRGRAGILMAGSWATSDPWPSALPGAEYQVPTLLPADYVGPVTP